MILKFLRGLGGQAAAAEPAADPVEYEGYSIVAAPQKTQGGWTTEGTISKGVGDDTKSQHFIRADTLMSREEAIDYTVRKAKRIIDEQGERLFRPQG